MQGLEWHRIGVLGQDVPMAGAGRTDDVAFLLSGDSDFERCVELLRSRGKRIYVLTSEGTLSRELSHVADKPIFFIEDYKETLKRDDKAPVKA